MMATFKSEFRKLLSVRATYIISLIALLLLGFVTFYVLGFKNVPAAKDPAVHLFLAGSIMQIATVISIFCALLGLLLVANEYRYNTIVYTLAASKSRSRVLLAKLAVILIYVFCFTVVLALLGLGLIMAGAAVSGHHLAHQDINYLTYLAKVVFFGEAFGLTGMVFALLIRNQVGAIAALFILPNTVEGLLSLLLKKNSVYMPFTALQQVVQTPTVPHSKAAHAARDLATGYLTPGKGALVFLIYLVVTWIVAWYLFLKRDAN